MRRDVMNENKGYLVYAPDASEPFVTIDAAIERARTLSRKWKFALFVVEDVATKKPKGEAHNGAWHWVEPCKPCRGTGRVPPYQDDCQTCCGRGVARLDLIY